MMSRLLTILQDTKIRAAGYANGCGTQFIKTSTVDAYECGMAFASLPYQFWVFVDRIAEWDEEDEASQKALGASFVTLMMIVGWTVLVVGAVNAFVRIATYATRRKAVSL